MERIVLSNKVVVSDPTYEYPSSSQATLDNVKPGEYHVGCREVDEEGWGIRVSLLTAVHWKYKEIPLDWEEHETTIGVDTAMAGIFNLEAYMGGFYSDWDLDRLMLGKKWETLPGGVVSESGIGDGGYILHVAKDGNEIVALCLDYCLEDQPVMDWYLQEPSNGRAK